MDNEYGVDLNGKEIIVYWKRPKTCAKLISQIGKSENKKETKGWGEERGERNKGD